MLGDSPELSPQAHVRPGNAPRQTVRELAPSPICSRHAQLFVHGGYSHSAPTRLDLAPIGAIGPIGKSRIHLFRGLS